MRIVVDVGHPGHVHYFRNAIKLLEEKGHEVLVTARDKEVTFSLLNAYNIPFVPRGKGGKGLIGKLLYILKGDYHVFRAARRFKADLFLSFASSYAAHVSKLMGKPHIAFDDTEHAKLEHLMYVPFTDLIVTPNVFRKNLGKNHVRFNGYIELCCLAPPYFTPDPAVLADAGLKPGERFVVVRFVSFEASHDTGQSGLNHQQKIDLVKGLSQHVKVIISSEGKLPKELVPYQLKLAPYKLHSLLAYSSLYIGEGFTTATEGALMGVPNIIVSSLLNESTRPGVQVELNASGLQELFITFDGVLEKALQLLEPEVKATIEARRVAVLASKIDVTAFMVWLIENYPQSADLLKENPANQDRFMLSGSFNSLTQSVR
jgi:uncharacterized protein